MKVTVRYKDKKVGDLLFGYAIIVIGEETSRIFSPKERQFFAVGDGCGRKFLLDLDDMSLLVEKANGSLKMFSFSRILPEEIILVNGHILRFKKVIKGEEYSLIEIKNEDD